MVQLKPGDRVDLLVKLDAVVSPHDIDYDRIITLEVISNYGGDYYCFVPPYLSLTGSIKVDKRLCSTLSVDIKFIDDFLICVKASLIYKINRQLDGCYCSNCGIFCHFAEPNQFDNSFKCWSCRQDAYR